MGQLARDLVFDSSLIVSDQGLLVRHIVVVSEFLDRYWPHHLQ